MPTTHQTIDVGMTPPTPAPGLNGKPHGPQQARVAAALQSDVAVGYRPTLPLDTMWGPEGMPLYLLRRDIEYMLWHPMVRTALSYYESGVAGAEFWGGQNPENPEDEKGLPVSEDKAVAAFVLEQCQRFWDWGVPTAQMGYPYGYIGGENMYADDRGLLRWSGLIAFSPYDTFPLTQDHNPVGVRVKNIPERGSVDMPFQSGDIPAKAFWYCHRPRWNRFWGQSQLIGAWRPWRRAAWKDGAEMVQDMGIYRFGVGGCVIRYPVVDIPAAMGTPYATQQADGSFRRYARDDARQMAEQWKSGAALALPNTKTDGEFDWSAEFPVGSMNVNGITDYVKVLYDQISHGVGVPPELLQASETGSGYSGRVIPVQAFLDGQQRIADALLQMFIQQVLRPLVWWNFGREAAFKVKVKSLLKTRAKQSGSKEQGGQQPPNAANPGQQPGTQQGGGFGGAPQGAPSMYAGGGNTATLSLGGAFNSRIAVLARRALERRAA